MTYIVIFQQIIGSPGTRYTVDYSWVDGREFDTKQAAIDFGFERRESDDFNIGHLNKNHKLIGFYWMKERLDYPLKEIATYIGL